jgi:hypothetical protein
MGNSIEENLANFAKSVSPLVESLVAKAEEANTDNMSPEEKKEFEASLAEMKRVKDIEIPKSFDGISDMLNNIKTNL